MGGREEEGRRGQGGHNGHGDGEEEGSRTDFFGGGGGHDGGEVDFDDAPADDGGGAEAGVGSDTPCRGGLWRCQQGGGKRRRGGGGGALRRRRRPRGGGGRGRRRGWGGRRHGLAHLRVSRRTVPARVPPGGSCDGSDAAIAASAGVDGTRTIWSSSPGASFVGSSSLRHVDAAPDGLMRERHRAVYAITATTTMAVAAAPLGRIRRCDRRRRRGFEGRRRRRRRLRLELRPPLLPAGRGRVVLRPRWVVARPGAAPSPRRPTTRTAVPPPWRSRTLCRPGGPSPPPRARCSLAQRSYMFAAVGKWQRRC